jgi:nucleoid DNA-binding protein
VRARRGDLLDAMAERSPMRRADLKVVMELVLEEMGKLLDDKGDELVLPPLGKLSVKKRVPARAAATC